MCFSDKQMKTLKSDLKTSRQNAFADSTTKNLRTQWESFLLFCFYFNLSYLPVDTETLCLYSQFLSRSFKSTNTIKNYMSGIKTMHHILGFSVDQINDFLLNLSIRGIARLHPHCVKQSKAITPELLTKFSLLLDLSNPKDSVFWCLFLFVFFLFARKSNLVPTSLADLKKDKCIFLKDVQVLEDHLIVSFRWSKTIQFGERILQTPLVKIPGSVLCPVKAFTNMYSLVDIQEDDPLFTLPNKKCIFCKDFQSKLRHLIKAIGLNPDEFSSHGFRRGGCTYAFKSGVPADLVQLHGDWHSDAYKKYLEFSLEDKMGVAERMKLQILKKAN